MLWRLQFVGSAQDLGRTLYNPLLCQWRVCYPREPPLHVSSPSPHSHPHQLHWRTNWDLKCQAWFRSLDTSEANSQSHGKTEDCLLCPRGPHSLILKDSAMPRVGGEMGTWERPWQCPFKKLLLPSAVKKSTGLKPECWPHLSPLAQNPGLQPSSSLEAACLGRTVSYPVSFRPGKCDLPVEGRWKIKVTFGWQVGSKC